MRENFLSLPFSLSLSLSLSWPICLFISLSISLSVYLFIYFTVYLSISLSLYLSISLSLYLSISLSISLFLSAITWQYLKQATTPLSWWEGENLCFLHDWKFFILFCFINSGFLTAIVPYRPASESLLFTVDIDSFFFHNIGSFMQWSLEQSAFCHASCWLTKLSSA